VNSGTGDPKKRTANTTIAKDMVLSLLETDTLRKDRALALCLLAPARLPRRAQDRQQLASALIEVSERDSTRVAAVIRLLDKLTCGRWFPCPACGGVVGPDTRYMCYRTTACWGVLCPVCGGRASLDGGCAHLVGVHGDGDGTDIVFLPVRWPSFVMQVESEVDDDEWGMRVDRLPARLRSWLDEALVYFDYDVSAAATALAEAGAGKGASAALQRLCLGYVPRSRHVRAITHDPPGGGPGTGVSAYRFATNAKARAEITKVVNASVGRLVECLTALLLLPRSA
jgi:hypothetical protein